MIVNEKLLGSSMLLEDDSLRLNLFFITRVVKEGVSKSAKLIDRHEFKAFAVDISSEVKNFFVENIKKQIQRVSWDEKYELLPYDVIADDLPDKLYHYALNSSLSFASVFPQFYSLDTPSISNLKQIKDGLWAYCVKVCCGEESFLVFRRITRAKVLTDQKSRFEAISSFFDASTSELRISNFDSISFDDKLDCIYVGEEFFVFRKASFETMVGLEEEFKEAARSVIEVIGETGLVEGVEKISELAKDSRALLKTLSNIARKGHHTNISAEEIVKMKEVLRRFEGKDLKVTEEDKLLLEDKNDVGYFVKLLNDYYKQGMVSGDYYGTNSGRKLSLNKE